MITELTQKNVEQVLSESGIPLVVEFYSPTCVHCKRTEAGLAELSEELEGKAVFAKCNIADETAIAQRYDVTALPTLLFIKDGDIKNKLVGFTHKLIVAENIKKLY